MFLKQFASRSEANNDKYFIWQFSKSLPPVEISTKDAAVGKNFYGDTEQLKSAFNVLETSASEALHRINSGEDLVHFYDVLRKFVWTQSLRTKAIKEQFHSAISAVLVEFSGTAKESKLAERIRDRVIRQFDELVTSDIARQPLSERIVLEEMMLVPEVRKLALDAALKKMASSDVQAVLTRLITTVGDSGFIGQLVTNGLNNGLLKLLEDSNPPEGFAPSQWYLINYHEHALILGDACTMSIDNSGNIGSLQKFGKDWQSVFLPVAHDRLLVGTKDTEAHDIDPNLINWASAGLSQEQFFCSHNSKAFKNLQSAIGSIEPMISADEIQQIAEGAWDPKAD